MSKEYQYIADRMKERRNELGLSLQDLAKKTGMNKSTLQRYETGGIKNIPISKLNILSKALQMDPEQLVDFESIVSPQQDKLYDYYIDSLNNGKSVTACTVRESQLVEAYRSADETTKEMAERILFYQKNGGKKDV